MQKKGHVQFYTPDEIAKHCYPHDCWVSALGHVYNLTDLVAEHAGNLTRPIIQMAGKDISHWFDTDTRDVRYPQTSRSGRGGEGGGEGGDARFGYYARCVAAGLCGGAGGGGEEEGRRRERRR